MLNESRAAAVTTADGRAPSASAGVPARSRGRRWCGRHSARAGNRPRGGAGAHPTHRLPRPRRAARARPASPPSAVPAARRARAARASPGRRPRRRRGYRDRAVAGRSAGADGARARRSPVRRATGAARASDGTRRPRSHSVMTSTTAARTRITTRARNSVWLLTVASGGRPPPPPLATGGAVAGAPATPRSRLKSAPSTIRKGPRISARMSSSRLAGASQGPAEILRIEAQPEGEGQRRGDDREGDRRGDGQPCPTGALAGAEAQAQVRRRAEAQGDEAGYDEEERAHERQRRELDPQRAGGHDRADQPGDGQERRTVRSSAPSTRSSSWGTRWAPPRMTAAPSRKPPMCPAIAARGCPASCSARASGLANQPAMVRPIRIARPGGARQRWRAARDPDAEQRGQRELDAARATARGAPGRPRNRHRRRSSQPPSRGRQGGLARSRGRRRRPTSARRD